MPKPSGENGLPGEKHTSRLELLVLAACPFSALIGGVGGALDFCVVTLLSECAFAAGDEKGVSSPSIDRNPAATAPKATASGRRNGPAVGGRCMFGTGFFYVSRPVGKGTLPKYVIR